MKIEVKTNKVKEFKPIVIDLKITVETENEYKELINVRSILDDRDSSFYDCDGNTYHTIDSIIDKVTEAV